MIIAFETALVIMFLSIVAFGIALLGDHVAQILSRNDPWPVVKTRRRIPATPRNAHERA